MAIKQIAKGESDWNTIINDNFAELAGNGDNFTIGDWQSGGVVGLNGFGNLDCKLTTFNANGHQLNILAVEGRTPFPAMKASAKIDAFSLPYHFDHGEIVSAYPIMDGMEVVRVQISPTTGSSTKVVVDNASSLDLTPSNQWFVFYVLWTD